MLVQACASAHENRINPTLRSPSAQQCSSSQYVVASALCEAISPPKQGIASLAGTFTRNDILTLRIAGSNETSSHLAYNLDKIHPTYILKPPEKE